MEEQWRIYLKDNAPKLYDEMLSSVKWAAEWRDNQITELKQKCRDKDVAIVTLKESIGALLTLSEFDTTNQVLTQKIEAGLNAAKNELDPKKGECYA